jgi:CheY-like chemotaxis protein
MTAVPSILLIEDNEADIELVEIGFQELGAAVQLTPCRDGAAAAEAIRGLRAVSPDRHPELILLDLNLPRMSGRELLALVRSQPETASIPVVVLTSSNHPRDRADCVALGATAYELKPGDLDSLLQVLSRATRHLRGAG